MGKCNNGGYAFPGFKFYTNGVQTITGKPYGGMTLRDYFAAKAMQSIHSVNGFNINVSNTAKWAYAMADAMLAERENQ